MKEPHSITCLYLTLQEPESSDARLGMVNDFTDRGLACSSLFRFMYFTGAFCWSFNELSMVRLYVEGNELSMVKLYVEGRVGVKLIS